MYTLMTNDVEHTSITKNGLSFETGEKVSNVGIPRLLELYSKNNVTSTFYFTGEFARDFPLAVQEVKKHGHEIGCHGFSHRTEHSFDEISPKEQFLHLKLAKRTIEKISGPIEAFRAPALRLGNETPKILEMLGFKTDSSIASQRFDGPLTFGSLRKLNWLFAKRKPYFLSARNPFYCGETDVLELPVSSAVLAYQGTTMRVSPKINDLLGDFLHKESTESKPIVFLFHPNEAITEKITDTFNFRGKNFFSRLFGDRLRRNLKLRNLGSSSIKLLQRIIDKSKREGNTFVTASQYRKIFIEKQKYNNEA